MGELVEIVVEWLKDDAQRYEWDERVRRVVAVDAGSKGRPPEHYGCVPGALCPGDGELLDVLLLDEPETRRSPGDLLPVWLIGVLWRSDGDHKLLAVDAGRPGPASLDDVPPERLRGIWRWFDRQHVLLGWRGHDGAQRALDDARRLWLLTEGGP